MRLLTFRNAAGEPRLGALHGGDEIIDLAISHAGNEPALSSMQALIDAGPAGLELARAALSEPPPAARLPQASVQLLAPLPRPLQIRDFLGFEQHLQDSLLSAARLRAARSDDPAAAFQALIDGGAATIPDAWYRQPVYYKANRFAISGPGDDILWPVYSAVMDYELELAAVIGKPGKDIPRERALEHVFGYTIFNDFSARDAQMAEMPAMLGPAKGKDFDGANAFGPCIVTADEIPDPAALTMIARVNGEERCRASFGTIHHSFAAMIAHLSQSETLHAGEVLGSGTVGGGCGLERMQFLEAGDRVELEIQPIGILANRVLRAGSTT